MRDARTTAKLLRALADCVDASSATEIEALLDGEAELKISRASKKQSATNRNPSESDIDIEVLASNLSASATREEGEAQLDRLQLVRRDLERLARNLGLPISKEDNTQRLREKIIEGTIGGRLASQAVRGNH